MMVTVTGGSGSGKSAYAESRAAAFDSRQTFYVAAMKCLDDESLRRVERHRRMRSGKGFVTIERHTDIGSLVLPGDGHGTVLLECMTNLAANECFLPEGCGPEKAAERIKTGIDSLRGRCDNLIVVTGEVFSDSASYDPSTCMYRQILGQINSYLAFCSDETVEVVYGIPVPVRGKSS